jgi:integrase
MGQLENPDHLANLPDETTRHLLIVIQETGLRANDACALEFNLVIIDGSGWPCLTYYSAKMPAEQLVPLSQRAADAIRAQQNHVHDR